MQCGLPDIMSLIGKRQLTAHASTAGDLSFYDLAAPPHRLACHRTNMRSRRSPAAGCRGPNEERSTPAAGHRSGAVRNERSVTPSDFLASQGSIRHSDELPSTAGALEMPPTGSYERTLDAVQHWASRPQGNGSQHPGVGVGG